VADVVTASPPKPASPDDPPSLGEYILPADGNYPPPPDVSRNGPPDGTPIGVAHGWHVELLAAEHTRASLLVQLAAVERRRRLAWRHYLDVMGYRVVDLGGPIAPLPSEAAGPSAGGSSTAAGRRNPARGGKGKARAANAEEESDGRMDVGE
jgi:hypothetical protein